MNQWSQQQAPANQNQTQANADPVFQQFQQCKTPQEQEQFVRDVFAQRGVDLNAFAKLNGINI